MSEENYLNFLEEIVAADLKQVNIHLSLPVSRRNLMATCT